jgi:FdrA protein
MQVSRAEVRSGAYYDSVVLMQLQRSLSDQPGVFDAGVVMGTRANKEILARTGMLVDAARESGADDLVIVVLAEDETSADDALGQVDELLARERGGVAQDYCPLSLESAATMLPDADWVLVSVPGRYAAGVAREALQLRKHVFLYSDNVSVDDERDLKRTASGNGLLVMGPDCGTAIVNGIGLGFANGVARGPIGMVAASGTGLQQVSARIHQLGSGITHALGTGGRDLSEAIGAVAARQSLDLLIRDPDTQVIVLVSKPASHKMADDLLAMVRASEKPVVVDFIGYPRSVRRVDNLHFAGTFDETAELAVELATHGRGKEAQAAFGRADVEEAVGRFASGQRYLRGLFSGGTLAYEALLLLRDYVPTVYSNVPLAEEQRLANSMVSQGHTIVDLGEDEFTVGRLHPMMDNDLRIRRLLQEADDPEVAVILLDIVLGYGAHPDPAGELAPAIARARQAAEEGGRHLEVVAVLVGTDRDPQGLEDQAEKLTEAGARVDCSNDRVVGFSGRLVRAVNSHAASATLKPVSLSVLQGPFSAINVGLESFADSLASQDAAVLHVDWRPPAGGNEKLMSILERMRVQGEGSE